MQPNLIKSTADSALELLDFRGRGSAEAFLLSWVAWEGLKVRVLAVGLHTHGWSVADIYESLPNGRIYQDKNYGAVFHQVFGTSPHGTQGVSSTWAEIEAFRDVRHRYVHGARGSSPAKLEAATHLITERVLEPQWLAVAKVSTTEGKVPLGDPYRRLVTARGRTRSRASLNDMLKSSIKR